MADPVGRPGWSALTSMMNDLRGAFAGLKERQRKIMSITATAWSDDRLVKVTVGPRGQLIELEIDPRVYRSPNSKALAATILSTVRAAVEEVMAKTAEAASEGLPNDLKMGRLGPTDVQDLMLKHDSELVAEGTDDG